MLKKKKQEQQDGDVWMIRKNEKGCVTYNKFV